MSQPQYAPGMRLEIRDAEWRLTRMDHSSDGEYVLHCTGLSELVRGREASFLTRLEPNIRVLAPEKTALVDDLSPGFRAGLLNLDTQLRATAPADDAVQLGHMGAMDTLDFQLEPTRQALRQPRQRILIADSVGLGKTLEAGILTSELIHRGRGKRILVLAVKSMLSQFQQEFWNRFTIPLTRLDSVGLARVRRHIPSNHNPFHYYDRAIVSIDTLKQDLEYRHYLEQAYWDIIIIDEAHNVAERGSHSQRARLARLLATRSDTLIMLSATPHDGKAESFASLVNMLDPTAIADTSNYAHEDFRDKGLVIRRFKKDVRDQLGEFPDREIDKHYATASPLEERAYDLLMETPFQSLDGKGRQGLFRTTLEKALFSSPAACTSILANRLKALAKREQTPERNADIENLTTLHDIVSEITPDKFGKYQALCELIGKKAGQGGLGWTRTEDDRLVIFTESLKTLDFLREHIERDCGLKAKQIGVLKGTDSDRDLMATVESFNRGDSPLRLLLCSDVASEGINLHHLAHRMVHFDIPWSLMVFQQRNGRIDRYGQRHTPQIRYLLTESTNARVRGDQRVLEVLIDKDDQASRNIGDPSEFATALTQQEQEEKVAEVMAADTTSDAGQSLFEGLFDLDNPMEDTLAQFTPEAVTPAPAKRPRGLYEDTLHWAGHALRWLDAEMRDNNQSLQMQVDRKARRVELTAPSDLRQQLKWLPREIRPAHDRFILSDDIDTLKRHFALARQEDSPWPSVQYLWPLHPVMQWLRQRVLNAFGRHRAPVMRVPSVLATDEALFVLHGGYPNKRGQSLMEAWIAVPATHVGGKWQAGTPEPLEEALERLELNPEALPNPGIEGDTRALAAALPAVVDRARVQLSALRKVRENELNERLNVQMSAMDELKKRHHRQLDLTLESSREAAGRKQQRRDEATAGIERTFDDYEAWLEDTQMLESLPFIQVAAVLTGEPAARNEGQA
ncbi:DEAD/DEAH box helicase [bacterium Scap17]|nr:DEAD/DEAH box helicase [bacterium Scap17]